MLEGWGVQGGGVVKGKMAGGEVQGRRSIISRHKIDGER